MKYKTSKHSYVYYFLFIKIYCCAFFWVKLMCSLYGVSSRYLYNASVFSFILIENPHFSIFEFVFEKIKICFAYFI